jgi:hypothetical protein
MIMTAFVYQVERTMMFILNDSCRFHDEELRRQTEEKQQLDEMKRDVFNLPDRIEYGSLIVVFDRYSTK